LQAVPNKKSYPQFIPNTIAAVALSLPGCYTTRMTKKDYQLIADTIDSLISRGKLSPHTGMIVAERFSTDLCGSNPNYSKSKFYDAATKSLARMEAKYQESCS